MAVSACHAVFWFLDLLWVAFSKFLKKKFILAVLFSSIKIILPLLRKHDRTFKNDEIPPLWRNNVHHGYSLSGRTVSRSFETTLIYPKGKAMDHTTSEVCLHHCSFSSICHRYTTRPWSCLPLQPCVDIINLGKRSMEGWGAWKPPSLLVILCT